MKKRWISIAKGSAVAALVLTGLTVLFPRPAAAIFGFGDIVFDPSSYATLGKIFTSDASLLAKTIQTYNQTVKIYQNGLNLYEQAKYMSLRFAQPQRMSWQTLAQTAVNDFTQNRYGETVNWPAMVNAIRNWHPAPGLQPRFPLLTLRTYPARPRAPVGCWHSRRRMDPQPSVFRPLHNTGRMPPRMQRRSSTLPLPRRTAPIAPTARLSSSI